MSKKCWNPPDSPQSWTLTVVFDVTWWEFLRLLDSFHMFAAILNIFEPSWGLFGGFPCLPSVIFMTVVVLNLFTGASLCLCGCFCIFGGLSSHNCNLAFLCNHCLWSHYVCLEMCVPFGMVIVVVQLFILLIFVIILLFSVVSLYWSIFTVCCYCLVFAFLWQFHKDTSSFRLCCMALYCFLFVLFTWCP